MSKTVSILGCGWYGFALAKALAGSNYQVKGSTTSEDKLKTLEEAGIAPYLVKFDGEGADFDQSFFQSETLIISLPPKRSSAEHTEYPNKIRLIVAAAKKSGVKQVLMISSTSVYGDVNREVNEGENPNPDTESGKAIAEAEGIIQNEKAFKSTILRFGGLIGPGRNLAKFFAGKTDIANGLAPVNLLHLEDCIRLTIHLLENDGFGYVFNACSPDHPTRKDLYTLAAKIASLEEPQFVNELLKWKLVNANLVSTKLNYNYLVNNWSDWLSPDKL
ncbi:MAG: NAD-dependent epimerase/dehydratase family protein [Pedobacter sp.]|nr:MAG: NAD-dependent epimerase/dehydratase family protein [Pedobacter sp.]